MSSSQDTSRKVLAHAAAQIGGIEALARRLGLSARVVGRYLRGEELIPDRLLLLAVDVIAEQISDPARVLEKSAPDAQR